MAPGVISPAHDRVERRRAVALARHFREAEGRSNTEIAERLGRSAATIKDDCYDPTGEKARAVQVGYVGVCRGLRRMSYPRAAAMARATARGEKAHDRRRWPLRRGNGPKVRRNPDARLVAER